MNKTLLIVALMSLLPIHAQAKEGDGGLLTQRGLGTVNLLPPTLTAQWHFNPDEIFDPYVGAGASYIRALDNGATANTTVGDFPIKTSRNSFWPALQAGLDINVKRGWLVNFDVKKIWFNKDIELNAPVLAAGFKKVDELGVHPWILSIGLGKKF